MRGNYLHKGGARVKLSNFRLRGDWYSQDMESFDEIASRVRQSLNHGESVLLAGVPASGKTTLLAQLLVDNPEMLVLSANAGAARRLSERALELRSHSEAGAKL